MTHNPVQFLKIELFPFFKGCFASKSDRYYLAIIVLIGAFLRLYFIEQPMRVDESWTFMASVKDGWQSVLTYVTPNNHVLHSIFVKISTDLFGAHPWSIRLPAFIFGTLAIGLVFCAARCFGSKGLFAALVVALNPYMILFSTNARGYSLLVCLFLLLIIVVWLFARNPTQGGSAVTALVAALGMLAIPTMVFPLTGLMLWMAHVGLREGKANRSAFLSAYVFCCIKIVVLTLVFYSPVLYLSGVKAIVANDWVIPQAFGLFLKGIRWHLEDTLFHFIRDIPMPFLVICMASVLAGFYASAKEKDNRMISLLCTLVLGGGAVFFAQHSIPFERTWIYFIPVFALIADKGMSFVFSMSGRSASAVVIGVVFILAFQIPMRLLQTESVNQYNDTGSFTDSAEVAQLLTKNMRTGDFMSATDPENFTLFFYLWYFQAPTYQYGEAETTGKTFYVVPPGRTIDQLTNRKVQEWKQINQTRIYR